MPNAPELPLRELIAADYRRYRSRSTSFFGVAQRHGFWGGLSYRVCHHLQVAKPAAIPRVVRSILIVTLSKLAVLLCGVEIQPATRVGPGLVINHFGPLVVHHDVVIGANCNLGHGVTIGIGGRGGARGCPVIGDGVWIGPQCVIFGPIEVGDDVAIGAGSILSTSVPDHAVVVGNPARVVSLEGASDLLGRR
jgi:serine O-acetyltransferase